MDPILVHIIAITVIYVWLSHRCSVDQCFLRDTERKKAALCAHISMYKMYRSIFLMKFVCVIRAKLCRTQNRYNIIQWNDANGFISCSTRFSLLCDLFFPQLQQNMTTKHNSAVNERKKEWNKKKNELPIESRWQYCRLYGIRLVLSPGARFILFIHFVSVSSHFKFLNFNWPPIWSFSSLCARLLARSRSQAESPRISCVFFIFFHSFVWFLDSDIVLHLNCIESLSFSYVWIKWDARCSALLK